MSAERPDPEGPRQPDYGDGGRPPEALVADDASDKRPSAAAADERSTAAAADDRPSASAADERLPAEAAGEPEDYRAPERGGEGPPAEATPEGEPLTPMAPAEDGDPPFTDPFGPSG